jgi:2-oxoisovalerate dehydrogenase E1 component alpha subunit
MPSHFSHPGLRIVSGSAPVATQFPHAVGVALAAKLRGLDEVAVTYVGDGGTSVGDVHEAMNFAGVHKLAVIFVCENNQYAISVKWTEQSSVPDVAVRAAVYAAAKDAVDRARRGEGPTFIEAKTYRLVPHTSDDDDTRYRSREEVDEWARRDPILRFRTWLEEQGIATADEIDALQAEVNQIVDEATAAAEAAPMPEPESALRHVFVEEEPSS